MTHRRSSWRPPPSRIASTRSSRHAESPRPSTWSSSCCRTRTSPRRKRCFHVRHSARPGWRRRPTKPPCPPDEAVLTGTTRPASPAALCPASRAACIRSPGLRTIATVTSRTDSESNEQGLRARSLKLAAFQKTLSTPDVLGDPEGDLLVIGWGSTKGAIEEAVLRVRAQGARVSSMHLRFLQPLPPGLAETMARFRQVLTIESNWSDRPDDELIDADNRRFSALAMMLRSRYLVDVDCWSQVRGAPIRPSAIIEVIRARLGS